MCMKPEKKQLAIVDKICSSLFNESKGCTKSRGNLKESSGIWKPVLIAN